MSAELDAALHSAAVAAAILLIAYIRAELRRMRGSGK